MKKGQLLALSVPTWAPALQVNLGGDTSWRSSRPKGSCNDTAEQLGARRRHRQRPVLLPVPHGAPDVLGDARLHPVGDRGALRGAPAQHAPGFCLQKSLNSAPPVPPELVVCAGCCWACVCAGGELWGVRPAAESGCWACDCAGACCCAGACWGGRLRGRVRRGRRRRARRRRGRRGRRVLGGRRAGRHGQHRDGLRDVHRHGGATAGTGGEPDHRDRGDRQPTASGARRRPQLGQSLRSR